ncbi:MAG: hypothetical protein UH850_07105 [Paludibacteraceae bacterium]|nr:hypothetical protein [Paludibacteraceae bacterium]
MKKVIRQIVRYVSLVSILAFAESCEKNDDEGKNRMIGIGDATAYAEHYIPYYVEPYSLVLDSLEVNYKYHSEVGFPLKIEGRVIEEGSRSEKDEYEALAKKYGDEGFNRRAIIERDGAISVAIDSITVVSDADIDVSHPKGSSLTDIIKLYSNNYYTYVKSGYNIVTPENDKLISEYTKDDLTLLFYQLGLKFRFDNYMEIKGTHNLTITIYFEDGEKLSTIQTVKFN